MLFVRECVRVHCVCVFVRVCVYVLVRVSTLVRVWVVGLWGAGSFSEDVRVLYRVKCLFYCWPVCIRQ